MNKVFNFLMWISVVVPTSFFPLVITIRSYEIGSVFGVIFFGLLTIIFNPITAVSHFNTFLNTK